MTTSSIIASRFEPILRAYETPSSLHSDETKALLVEFTKLFEEEEFHVTVPIYKSFVKKIATEDGENVAIFLFIWTEEQGSIDDVISYSTYVKVPKVYNTVCPELKIQTLEIQQRPILHNVYYLPNGLPIAWIAV